MGTSLWAATKSKDPDTQVGARIVSVAGKPLGTGYNGPPAEYNDADVDWSRPEKYSDIIHAEMNAIRFSDYTKLQGATIYVTGRPCRNCMLNGIIAYGITKVVYLDPKWRNMDSRSMITSTEEWEIVQDQARKGRVQLVKFSGNLNWMRDQMDRWEELGFFD